MANVATITPGGRRTEEIELAPFNAGQQGQFAPEFGTSVLSFSLGDSQSLISAQKGVRLVGKIRAEYKTLPDARATNPTTSNKKLRCYLSPSAGVHGLIQSITTITGDATVVERVQNYSQLAANIKTLAKSEIDVLCDELQESYAVRKACDIQLNSKKSNNKNVAAYNQVTRSALWFNEVNNLNQQDFSIRLHTGMFMGAEDINLAMHRGMRININLARMADYLFCPEAYDYRGGQVYQSGNAGINSINNVRFWIEDVKLVYELVHINPPLNRSNTGVSDVIPAETLLTNPQTSDMVAYTVFRDEKHAVTSSSNYKSVAPSLPASNLILWSYKTQRREQGTFDPLAADPFNQDRFRFTIAGSRYGFLDQLTEFELLAATMESLAPMGVMSNRLSLDPSLGVYAINLDTYSAGPNMMGTNRPELAMFLKGIQNPTEIGGSVPGRRTAEELYNNALIAIDTYSKPYNTTTLPASMNVFVYGATEVSIANQWGGRSMLM